MADEKNKNNAEKAAKEAQAKAKKEAAAGAVKESGPKREKAEKGSAKMSRRERKEREKELAEAGEVPLRNQYRPRGLFWRIFGVCLAFFMGIFVTVGAAVGAGVILLNRPTKDLLNTLGMKTEDVEKFLADDYLNRSVFAIYDDFMTEILPTLSDPSNLSLNTISKYTPIVDNYIEGALVPNLAKFGVTLELTGLKNTPLKGIADYVMDDLLPGQILPQVKLGHILKLDKNVTLEIINGNAPKYALCYGKYGVDYTIGADGTIEGAGKSLADLLSNFPKPDGAQPTAAESGNENKDVMDVIGAIELGSFLGLDIRLPSEKENNDGIMYSLCYGTEGVDYEFVDAGDASGAQILHMRGEAAGKTVDDLINNTDTLISDMEVAAVLPIDADSEAIFRTLAFGNEMAKDEDGNYLKDPEDPTKYLTEADPDEAGKLQYAGGGRYVIEGEGDGAEIVMLPDPNDPDGKPYPKKTIADLTDSQDSLFEDVTIGSIIGDEGDSKILNAMKDWTINDLSDQSKIESLKISDVLDLENATGIMNAIKDWTLSDFSQQSRIERLKLGQILNIDEDDPNTSGIMKAMKNWRISELTKQEKINSLTLGSVIEIGDGAPQILKALRDMSLGEISTGIDTLTLEDVLGTDAFDGNKILSALRYKQIHDLGSAIGGLTVEDVFGDEIWSYAAKEGYNATERNTKLTGTVTTKYYYGDTEVFAGYYTGSDDDGWTKVADANVKYGSYAETRVNVEKVPSYKLIDYDKSESEWQSWSGSEEVRNDGNTDYFVGADGVRHDLDTTYTYTHNGGPVTDKRILTDEDGQSYYIEKTPVTARYAAKDATESYAKTDVTEKIFVNDAEATRYHSGVWYLLLGNSTEAPEITEMGALVTGVAAKINLITLGDMYIHELIDENPSTEITLLTKEIPDLQELTNLNQLTVNQVIKLISSIASKSKFA